MNTPYTEHIQELLYLYSGESHAPLYRKFLHHFKDANTALVLSAIVRCIHFDHQRLQSGKTVNQIFVADNGLIFHKISMDFLAESTGLNRSTVKKITDFLEEQNLIVKITGSVQTKSRMVKACYFHVLFNNLEQELKKTPYPIYSRDFQPTEVFATLANDINNASKKISTKSTNGSNTPYDSARPLLSKKNKETDPHERGGLPHSKGDTSTISYNKEKNTIKEKSPLSSKEYNCSSRAVESNTGEKFGPSRLLRKKKPLTKVESNFEPNIEPKPKVDRSKFKNIVHGKVSNVKVSKKVQEYIDLWNEHAESTKGMKVVHEFERTGPFKGKQQTKNFKAIVSLLSKFISGVMFQGSDYSEFVDGVDIEDFETAIIRLKEAAFDTDVKPAKKEWLIESLNLRTFLEGSDRGIKCKPLFLEFGLHDPEPIIRIESRDDDLSGYIEDVYAEKVLGDYNSNYEFTKEEIIKINMATNKLLDFKRRFKRKLKGDPSNETMARLLMEAFLNKKKYDSERFQMNLGNLASNWMFDTVLPEYLVEINSSVWND